jgi:hypothetical protein
MMKEIISLLLLLSLLGGVDAQNRKVNLIKNEPFENVLKQAKKEKKLIFLDFGSPRCSPCLFMKNNIFTIDSVADFVNERFVSADYTEGEEKTRLSKKYDVHTEPVFLLVDTVGKLMHRTEGKSTAGEMLERFRLGIDSKNNLAAQNLEYEKGNRDVNFIIHYLKTLHIAGLREKKQAVLANIFTPDFPMDSLIKVNYWNLYFKYDESAVSRQTLYVMDNMQKFIDLFGEKSVLYKIDALYGSRARIYIFGNKAPVKDPEFKTVLSYAQKSNHPNASYWLAYLVPARYKYSNWTQMAKEIENAMAFNILKGEKRYQYKSMMSEQLAWYCDDTNALQYSIKWIDQLLPTVNEEKQKSLLETKISVLEKIKKLRK